MLEQIIKDDDSSLGGGTDTTSRYPGEDFCVTILPKDLVRVVVEALRHDQLSPHQTALILDAAAESVLRQAAGSDTTYH